MASAAALVSLVGGSSRGSQAAAASASHGSWMARHRNQLAPLALARVSLLGSHDAGSCDVAEGNPPVSGYLTHHGKHITRHASAKDVLSARCQGNSIAAQLEAGVRYLDLRVASQDGGYFAVHEWLSTPLFGPGSVIAQIGGFLASHPEEVLVLDVAELYSATGEMNDGEAAALLNMISSQLPGLLLPTGNTATLTFGEIWSQHGRVVLLCGKARDLPFVWDNGVLDSHWFNQKDPETLMSDLDGVVDAWRAGQSASRLRLLQTMTTTGTKLKTARTTNALAQARLAGPWRGAPVSVFQVDDAAHCGLMPLLLAALGE